jgi:predicted ATPase
MGKKECGKPIERLTIRGFKSIIDLEKLQLNSLNILLGANGAGKSNFVSYFRMLSELVEQRLQKWTTGQGGADRIVSYGIKETNRIESFIEFGLNGYQFCLEPTVGGDFLFANERLFFAGDIKKINWQPLGSGHKESLLKESALKDTNSVPHHCYSAITSWKVFHFHDTSDTAGVKRWGSLQDNNCLRSDASNLAAYLFMLQNEHNEVYEEIRKTLQLAIPFFDDFVLKPRRLDSGEEQVCLMWKQHDSDYSLWPSQLSDGSIRFICLVTALMQPIAPGTIVIDEPELGLHPYPLVLLGALLRSASKRMQVIVSTQSVSLVNEFSIEDLIVVDRQDGNTAFRLYNEDEFANWLDTYSVGELWEKNILGGRPHK